MVLSTEWSQVELIELINEGNGLGFMLVGGRSTGVVIKAVIPGGAAERDGRMQAGDHVLQINDVALRGFSSDQVAQVLRQTGQHVRLIVARSVEPSSVDFQAISHAPIIPTKLLSDPEELDRILQQTGGYSTNATANNAASGQTRPSTTTTIEETNATTNLSLTIPAKSQAVPAIVSTTINEPPLQIIPTTTTGVNLLVTSQSLDRKQTTTTTTSITESNSNSSSATTAIKQTMNDMEVINNNNKNNNNSAVTSSTPTSLVNGGVGGGGTLLGVCNGNCGAAKRPADIRLPDPSSTVAAVQCEGIDSTTTTCSSEEALDLDSPETEVYHVELHKNVYGLGITVAGYVCEEEDLSGIFVKSIIEGSAAEMSGMIQINDRIVEVDGRSLNRVTNHQAVDILRQTDIAVNLRLERFLRGRKYEHLQTALTEMRSGGCSTPSTPMGSRSSCGMRTPRQQSMGGSTKSMDLIVEEKRSSEDSLEESRANNKKSKKQSTEDEEDEKDLERHSIPSCTVSKSNEAQRRRSSCRVTDQEEDFEEAECENERSSMSMEVPLGGGGLVVIENEMESHTTIDSSCYGNDFVINGDEEDDNELVMIEANHHRTKGGQQQLKTHQNPPQFHQHQHHHQQNDQSDPLVRHWQAQLPADTKVLCVEVNKLSGLGISLEGTVDVEGGVEMHPHHFIRSILEEGPVGRNGLLRPGDEILQVNAHRLQGLTHIEVVQIIKELPRKVKLVCARGPKPPSVINTSQSPDAFEARSILGPGGLKSLQNLLTTKAQSESSLYTSSTATLTDQQRSKSFEFEQVSGVALWTCEVVYVDVEKTDAGFGFSILDYQDPLDPDGTVIVIRGLIPGGAAEETNLIFPGDRLVYVNNVNLHGMTLDQAVAVLKCVNVGRVRLGLCRPLSTSDSNIEESPQSAAETPTT